MKFLNLKLRNFLTVGQAEITLDGKGLNLIQGSNEDNASAGSNGAGKSSLVEAICWCLFGVTARGIKGDSVVNIVGKKNCFAQLQLANGATRYTVTRYRKDATHKNALRLEVESAPGTLVDMSKGTDAETQKEVDKVLGCSLEVFMASVYCGQEAMADLPGMKDRELKTLIEEAAGLQRIERAYEVARSKASDKRSALTALTARVDTTAANRDRTKLQLDAAIERRDQWEAGRVVRVADAEKLVADGRAALVETAGRAKVLQPAALLAKTEIAEIDQALANHSKLLNEARVAARVVSGVENALAQVKTELTNATSQVKGYEAMLLEPEKYINEACDTCGHVAATMTVTDFVSHRAAHLAAAKAKQAEIAGHARGALAAVTAAVSAANAADAAVPDVSAANLRKGALQQSIKAFDDTMAEAERKKTAYTNAVAALDRTKTEPNPQESAVGLVVMSVANLEQSVTDLVAERNTAADACAVAEAVVKVFGPAGVRASILDTVTPYLNDRTADYLSILSDGGITAVWTTLTRGASGDLKEKFSIEVATTAGVDSFAGLSGGEKRKVRLAAALALQDLVATRATQPIDLFIGDEIDDALDPEGLERLMTILERKARERGTVLVISHSDLTAWIDEVTVVRKQGGVSTVEGSLCV